MFQPLAPNNQRHPSDPKTDAPRWKATHAHLLRQVQERRLAPPAGGAEGEVDAAPALGELHHATAHQLPLRHPLERLRHVLVRHVGEVHTAERVRAELHVQALRGEHLRHAPGHHLPLGELCLALEGEVERTAREVAAHHQALVEALPDGEAGGEALHVLDVVAAV
eukprot:1186579-Prorocentrum_minimum.AAC.2